MNFKLDEIVGYRTTPNSILPVNGTNVYSINKESSIDSSNESAFVQYIDCKSILSSMTPFDLCIIDNTNVNRNTIYTEYSPRMNNIVTYEIDYIDSTTIFPTKIIFKNKLSDKYGVIFDTTSTQQPITIKSILNK